MKIKEVRDAVEEIKRVGGFDDEAAHSKEDKLREAVLVAIAAGTRNAKGLAREALKTSSFDFARWCA